ncbi:hypothetical protein BU16DRAFT_120949 [Lophium mytilinum]|uniref:Uncharacterized protein n=1 Tax=Lophium mytilinum TaxID=390894 RepID=A0A6A6QJ98_9PEZI|nr:hypothetical protein BU16DRAFT_120949 [Lophium mytilinum]
MELGVVFSITCLLLFEYFALIFSFFAFHFLRLGNSVTGPVWALLLWVSMGRVLLSWACLVVGGTDTRNGCIIGNAIGFQVLLDANVW